MSAGPNVTAPFTGRERVYAFADSVERDAPRPATAHAAQWETWVTFVLGAETYAFPVHAILEIVRVGTITRVPDAPRPVRGIINLRGRVVPVVDLRVRLGLASAEPGAGARILVAGARGRMIGLLVDGVEQVVRLDRATFEAPPADVMSADSTYISAVCQAGRALLILLDAAQVLELSADANAPAGLRTMTTTL